MLGIIFIIFLARKIGHMAEDRGKVKWHFWIATIAAWYGGQFAFGLLAVVLIGIFAGAEAIEDMDSSPITVILSLIGGGIGYYILYSVVKRMPYPESPEELIDQIGKEEDFE